MQKSGLAAVASVTLALLGAASAEARTTVIYAARVITDADKPVQGPARTWHAEALDVTKATLDAFGRAAAGKEKFLIPVDEMVHGAAVTEAIIRSAQTHLPEKVRKA